MATLLRKATQRLDQTSSPSEVAVDETERIYRKTVSDLQKVYHKKIAPLERTYMFEKFHSEPLTNQDISAQPMVLLLGQYSTGKTTFLEYFLGHSYPGSHVGIEPTTDRFVAVMQGEEAQVIPGNTAAVSNDLPFKGLSHLGEKFLSRFQVSRMDNPLLQNLTFIDSPGILSGTKQVTRGYDFGKAIRWFVERSDMVLLLFDSHKLDISDEFKLAISVLRGHEDKTRVVLNKCNQVSQQELMRVYGALMWSLGRVVPTPEVIRVYLGSFWPASRPPLKHAFDDTKELLSQEQKDLLEDMRLIPKNAAIRRLNQIVKRTRQATVHAYICGHIRSLMPTFGSKEKKLKTVMDGLDTEFAKLQHKYNLAQGDFSDHAAFKHNCKYLKGKEFPRLDMGLVNAAQEALNADFPELMRRFPSNVSGVPTASLNGPQRSSHNPHDQQLQRQQLQRQLPAYSAMANIDLKNNDSHNPFAKGAILNSQYRFAQEFSHGVDPETGTISSSAAAQNMGRWGQDPGVMKEVWDYVDWRCEGRLDQVQFEAAMRICQLLFENRLELGQAKQQVFNELGIQGQP